jgi:hypothetical protein
MYIYKGMLNTFLASIVSLLNYRDCVELGSEIACMGSLSAPGLGNTNYLLLQGSLPEAGFLVRVHPEPCLILSRAEIRALLCSSKSKFIPAQTLTLLVLDKKTGLCIAKTCTQIVLFSKSSLDLLNAPSSFIFTVKPIMPENATFSNKGWPQVT